MKKASVTIGIPAYQAEMNIKNLLTSLTKQDQNNIKIEKILVYADGCTDKTVSLAKSVKNKKISVSASKKNHGFAYALQHLINKSKSDIFILLNDDIKIESSKVINELALPIIKNRKVGLVGGNIRALNPKTFVGRSIYTSYLAFLKLRYSIKKGETDLTCDGKILAFSKDFAKTLKLTKFTVGNVDIYLYYENLKQGRIYKFAKKAEVFFRLPETIADFKNQEARSAVSRKIVKERFGSLFLENHKFPQALFWKSVFKTVLKYPMETIFFKLFINTRLNIKKRSYSKWKLALTTKKLSLLGLDIESLLKQL